MPTLPRARAARAHHDGAERDIVKKSLEIAGDLCIYTNQHPHDRDAGKEIEHMTPQEIVPELDRHRRPARGQARAVAIALRNRWRRQQVDEKMRGEITPKNILMIGPTGVGKTEIARRLARLADAPFIKVEATKFTEVGYVGGRRRRDRARPRRHGRQAGARGGDARQRARAEDAAEERVLNVLVPGSEADNATRQVMRKRLREGALADKEIEIERRPSRRRWRS